MSTREPEFPCVHAGVSWLVGKYTSALHRRALCGVDHGVVWSTGGYHSIQTQLNRVAFLVVSAKLGFFSPAPGKEHAQPHGWRQVFGSEFRSGSSVSGCDAQP